MITLQSSRTQTNHCGSCNGGYHLSGASCVANKRAVELYTFSAEQGLAKASMLIGCLYAAGQGVEKSFTNAREWITKAAAQGYDHCGHIISTNRHNRTPSLKSMDNSVVV